MAASWQGIWGMGSLVSKMGLKSEFYRYLRMGNTPIRHSS